jgi:hypothetical protein
MVTALSPTTTLQDFAARLLSARYGIILYVSFRYCVLDRYTSLTLLSAPMFLSTVKSVERSLQRLGF